MHYFNLIFALFSGAMTWFALDQRLSPLAIVFNAFACIFNIVAFVVLNSWS